MGLHLTWEDYFSLWDFDFFEWFIQHSRLAEGVLTCCFWSFFTSSWWVFDDQGDGIYKSLWWHFCLWNWVPLIISNNCCHLFLQLLSDDNSVKIQRCDLRRSFFGVWKALAETTFSVCIRIHLDALHLRPEDGGEICHSNQLNIKTMRIEQSLSCLVPLICSIRHFVGVTPLSEG